jgi:beta-galactosidase
MGYGPIQLQKTAFLFDLLDNINPADVVESENPLSMESVGQVFNFIILSIYMYFF